MSEKRHFTRVDFVEQASLCCNNFTTAVNLVDISLKGALLQLSSPLPIKASETEGVITLHLEGSDIILTFHARAAHVHEKTVGFEFTTMDSDSMIHLRRLLELNTGDPEEIDRELCYMIQH